ncbi:unnamed protein product [Penicillium egyptiacum]|uniref:Uncharacterized protein n=1 Tax=Penicillium egyptiacum TaxID=1303716 RepID=A0A9W4KJ61_9EURO|nr:unnamed protein product [Penicillium egyptiacum]
MKYKAGLSFSAGSFFQASASYGHEEQHNGPTQNQNSHMQKTLSWEARGGDTIVCNDPPNWRPTVKPFANWRIINQKDVAPMTDFIGKFEKGEEVPQKIKKIRDASRKVVDCQFRLRAKGKVGVPNGEFYGLRTDDQTRLIKKVLEKYAEDLRKGKSDDERKKVDKHIEQLATRMESSDFTVQWAEHVGIHHYDAGCIFEIKVETVLNDHPELQLGVAYKLHNKHRHSWLMADTKGTYHEDHHYFGYLFYGREDRASKFMFNLPNARTASGGIRHGMAVELVLCDEEDQPAAVVQRFVHNETTLLVSEYGDNVTNDNTIAHPATLQYVN